MTRIDLYLLRRILPIISVILLLAGVMLMMERMLRLLEMTIGSGVSMLIVIRMLLELMPHYAQLILPLGLFLGVLLAFRDLSSHSELYIMESVGMGIARLTAGPAVLGLLMMVIGFTVRGYIEPISRYSYHLIYYNVQNGIVRSGLEEGSFVELPNNFVVRAARTHLGGREFSGFFAYRMSEEGHIETLTAKTGALIELNDGEDLALQLYDGRHTTWFSDSSDWREIGFDVFTLPLELKNISPFRGRGADERELTIDELFTAYRREQTGPAAAPLPEGPMQMAVGVRPQAIASELHGRLIYTLSIPFIPFLAVPFGIVTLRSSRAGGLVAGFAVLVSYQKVLEFGEEIASVSDFPSGLFLWSTFGVFAVATTAFFISTARAAGDTPFQKFEEAFWKALGRLRPRRRGKRKLSSKFDSADS